MKIKLDEAVVLSDSVLTNYLKAAPTLQIHPPAPRTLYPRTFLSSTYGGNPMHLMAYGRNGTRKFLFPTPDVNPQMPNVPGEAGLLLSARLEMLEHTWSVFSRIQTFPARWLYLGQYKNVRAGLLPSEEFAKQRQGVRFFTSCTSVRVH